MKTIRSLGWLPACLLLVTACSREAARDLPPAMVWDKDQQVISPAQGTMNVWEGFRADEDAFTAEREDAQFILWRARSERLPLTIEYSLQGGRAEFSVNVRQKKWLTPASGFKSVTLEFRVNRGMNFLHFAKKRKDKLRVRSITAGTPAGEALPHLRAGERFTLFHMPGSGRLELRGRGWVEIVEQHGGGDGLQAKVTRRKSGRLSGKLSHAIEFPAPGTLSVSARRGDFTIHSYRFAERPVPEAKAPPAVLKDTPNIYIILSDACQASHLGTYGYHRPTSPNIDAFARDAVVYENAYTNAVFTRSSVATLLTGLYPDSHKTRVLQAALPSQLLTMPEYLKIKGYRSSILTSTFGISPHFGFTQGVDDYFRVGEKRDARNTSIFEQFREWLLQAPSPHFSYMHYLHPHFPKVPPDDFPVSFLPGGEKATQERMAQLVKKRANTGVAPDAEELQEITDIYDSSIAWVDSEFGKIMTLIKERGLYDDSMIVFLADHGEALGEHQVLGHGGNVYDETSRVPLIIKYPRAMERRGRVHRLSELADIFPTIVSLFGQTLPLDGRILPLPGEELDDHMAVSRTFNRCPVYGLRWRNWYAVIDLGNSEMELFSLANGADPLKEVGQRYSRVASYLTARFLAWLARFRDSGGEATTISLKSLPASEIEEMKTLGYL